MAMNPFSSRCCQHNHSHGWPYYIENLWTATPDGGLAAVLYGASQVKAKVADGSEVVISEQTNYPFEEEIRFTVQLNKERVFPLYFRLPVWCDAMKIAVNGQDLSIAGASPANRWLKIERTWRNGDRIALQTPMSFSYRVWQQNKNCISIDYGPLTFSLKIKERYQKTDGRTNAMGDSGWQKGADASKWPSFEIFADSDWNYGLTDPAEIKGLPCLQYRSASPGLTMFKFKADEQKKLTAIQSDKTKNPPIQLIKKSWPKDNFPWTADSVPWSIVLTGKKIPGWKIDSFGLCAPVPDSPVETDQPKKDLELIPMGAARLRISAFPVVE